MLPLAKPELQDLLNPQPWPVQAKVAFRADHRGDSLVYDERETCEANDLDEESENEY
jgi:hypothetical protein